MPIYEFRCEACGERFEALVDRDSEPAECRICGSPKTVRVLSSPAPQMNLVKGRGETRKQERANAALHQRTKASFKESRQQARRRRTGGGPPKPGAGS